MSDEVPRWVFGVVERLVRMFIERRYEELAQFGTERGPTAAQLRQVAEDYRRVLTMPASSEFFNAHGDVLRVPARPLTWHVTCPIGLDGAGVSDLSMDLLVSGASEDEAAAELLDALVH